MNPTRNEQIGAVPTSAMPSVTVALKNVAGDVIALTELQAELLKLDLANFNRHSRKSLLIFAIAVLSFCASLPILMLAISHCIAEAFDLKPWHGMFIVATVTTLLSLVALAVGVSLLRTGLHTFERSVAELRKNIGWIKAMIKEN